jgi:pyruvate-formate lyase-activating enzyme
MHVAFVILHGEERYGFFDDTFVSLLCADARRAGHAADVVHVFFDGHEASRDAQVRTMLQGWLAEHETELVVCERAVDAASLADFAAQPGHTLLQVTRGDSLDPAPGAQFMLGALPGLTSQGRVARTPSLADLRRGFRAFMLAHAGVGALADVPGLCRIDGERLTPCAPIAASEEAWPFDPIVDHHVLALNALEPVTHKTVFGNVGCPYSQDPYKLPHYAGAEAPERVGLSRLGCAFCPMGGDYQVRDDAAVVDSVLAQAQYFVDTLPQLQSLLLSDQAPLRYLATLMRAAAVADFRPLRWLFPCRAEALLRGSSALAEALALARDAGQVLECYLVGFESFCQRELDRYNKGVQVAELVQSVECMRALKAEFPESFDYARAKGHSLVLFNPWTSPEDVVESASVMRQHGLCELFDEPFRNRLRLYADLPITYAAKRDGALLVSAEVGSGAGRRKGYSLETPWRFLDPRTQHLADSVELLRARLGPEAPLSQLLAAAEHARNAEAARGGQAARDPVARAVEPSAPLEGSLDSLDSALAALLRDDTRPRGLSRARTERAAPVLFAAGCNNGCTTCPNRDRYLSDTLEALAERVERARAAGHALLFAGREPSLHPAVIELLSAARGADTLGVGMVSNGRRFCYEAFTKACVSAGLRGVSVKLFAPNETDADAISRSPGAHQQALEGLRMLARHGVALEIRAPMNRENLGAYSRYAELGAAHGASLRVEVGLDGLGLENLDRARNALAGLVVACVDRGVALEASPLALGTRDFRFLPATP